MKYTAKDITDKINISEDEVLNVYMIGSRVYGTYSYTSDYDYIVVSSTNLNNKEFRGGELNIHVYTKEHFQNKLNEQKVQFIEAFMSPIKLKEEIKFNYTLNAEKMLLEFNANSNKTFSQYEKNKTGDKILSAKKNISFHKSVGIFFSNNAVWSNQ